MIKVGTKDITDIRLGDTAVKAVYLGSDKVWEKNKPVYQLYMKGGSGSVKINGNTVNLTQKGSDYYLSGFTDTVTSFKDMFGGNRSDRISVFDFNTSSSGVVLDGMFANCTVSIVNINPFKGLKVLTANGFVYGNSEVENLDLDMSECTSINDFVTNNFTPHIWFRNNWDMGKVRTINRLLNYTNSQDVISNTTIDISNWSLSSLRQFTMGDLYCTNLNQDWLTLKLGTGFFSSDYCNRWDFSGVRAHVWKNIGDLVTILPTITTAKTIVLNADTQTTLTSEQYNAITAKGWTISNS